MTGTYLIDSDIFNSKLDILEENGIEVLKHSCKVVKTDACGTRNNLTIKIHQFEIRSKKDSNKDIIYSISIPTVFLNGKPMQMLSKLKNDTFMGLSYLLNTLNDNYPILHSVEEEYNHRNNLLLTSHNAIGIISVVTDKQFINFLDDKTFIKKMSQDKIKLYKILSQAFISEIINYTEYHKILNYNYSVNFGNNGFNLLNIFTCLTDKDFFVHMTLNIQKNNGINDKLCRGYNFILQH